MSRKPLEYQIYLSQITGIILAIVISFAISLYYNLTNKQAFLDQNISNVGLLLSQSAEVEGLLSSHTPSHAFNEKLDSLVRNLEYIDVVTICDADSIRYYHNDKHKIGGTFFGNDETLILEGNSAGRGHFKLRRYPAVPPDLPAAEKNPPGIPAGGFSALTKFLPPPRN